MAINPMAILTGLQLAQQVFGRQPDTPAQQLQTQGGPVQQPGFTQRGGNPFAGVQGINDPTRSMDQLGLGPLAGMERTQQTLNKIEETVQAPRRQQTEKASEPESKVSLKEGLMSPVFLSSLAQIAMQPRQPDMPVQPLGVSPMDTRSTFQAGQSQNPFELIRAMQAQRR